MRRSGRAIAAFLPLSVLASLGTAVATPAATFENVRLVTNVPGNTGGHVVVEGNRLYMGNYGTGLSAYDITNPKAPVKIGQYLPGPSTAGGTDQGVRADAPPDAAVWNGKHVVSLGGTTRFANRVQTEFIDFTNPASPQLLWRFAGGSEAESHNGDIVDARKLWLPSGGSGGNGLRIYDMNPLLQTPAAAPTKVFAGNPHTLWLSSPYRAYYGKPAGASFDHTHDIEIYVDREILLPEWEWVDQDADGTKDPTYGKRDIALLAAAGSGNAVYVIDITNPSAPVVISKWQNSGGNAISYLHEAQFLQGDRGTIVATDEDFAGCEEGRVYTIGVTEDLVHTTKLAEWTIGQGAQGSPACLGSHVMSSNDKHLYMGSYVAGLQILDLTDPSKPELAGRYIAEGANSWGALYHNGYVYVGDFGGRGLDVFEFIPNPHAQGQVKVNNPAAATVDGIAETVGACDPASPVNGTDGLIVPIPATHRDGNHTIRVTGSSDGPYNLNVYFRDENCAFMSGTSLNSESPDEQGSIPEGAKVGVAVLVQGPPTYVYAQLDV